MTIKLTVQVGNLALSVRLLAAGLSVPELLHCCINFSRDGVELQG